MSRVTAKLLLFLFLFLLSNKPLFAADPYATESAVVSATVISSTFNGPLLISPDNHSVSNNLRPQLVWDRPSPLPSTPLHFYDLYLDGQVFAASVSDSISSQTYYFYSVRRDGDRFYLDLLTDLAQGYHTWSVVAYDTSGISAHSETRTFYLDSINPFILLEKVDRQTLNWNTANPVSIPNVNERDLTITQANPLLSGQVEPFANMQIVLLCPQNILLCQSQVYQGNYPSGIWQHRFYNLLKGLVYTVHISSTDAAGNSTIFPEFYLAYGVATPTPSAITSPTTSPTPQSPHGFPASLEPSITITPTVAPTPFIPAPPTSPTPPIYLEATAQKTINYFPIIFLLLVLGLPLHLLMTLYGTLTPVTRFFRLLLTLLFPFLGHKEFQTVPFANIQMYDPENLTRPWQTKIADINGMYGLSNPFIKKIYVKITSINRLWSNQITDSHILPTTCLIPLLDATKIHQDRLRRLSMTSRSLPLILAILTSSIALYIQPNYFYLIYLYISLQLTFSEHLYPHLSR